jgi:hypothetical protein
MTTTAVLTGTTTERTTPLWRTAARAGVVAALATTVVAAVALAADVPLEVDGEAIPLYGFAQLTLVGAAIGLVLAKALTRWATRPRSTFVAATIVLTVLSTVPDLFIPATAATKAVLIATHVVAAAIVIPLVASRLSDTAR